MTRVSFFVLLHFAFCSLPLKHPDIPMGINKDLFYLQCAAVCYGTGQIYCFPYVAALYRLKFLLFSLLAAEHERLIPRVLQYSNAQMYLLPGFFPVTYPDAELILADWHQLQYFQSALQ